MRRRVVQDTRLWLSFGFFFLATGTIIAYLSPATGYEPSIYSGTPVVFWMSVIFALVVSVVAAFHFPHRRDNRIGITLGGVAMIAVVALPLIRGYYYVGEHDAMTHLGWVRDINTGTMAVTELQYPAVHILGSIITDIGGIGLNHSLLILFALFVYTFFIFVPLAVRKIKDERLYVYTGIFIGLLILPINHIAGHMQVHTSTQAAMFAAIVLYLFIAYIKQPTKSFFSLFLMTVATLVILHPQQGVNLVSFLGAILVFQVLALYFPDRLRIKRQVTLLPVIGASVFIFWFWGSSLSGFESIFQGFIINIFFEPDGVGTDVASRGASLQQLGGSYGELFAKLFLTAFIFSILTGLLMLTEVIRTLTRLRAFRLGELFGSTNIEIRSILVYFTVGFIPLVILFFAYLLSDMSQYYFRVYAFFMVIISILGSVALGRLAKRLGRINLVNQPRTALSVVIVLLLFLSLPVVYSSPYMYETSGHVTETQMAGFEQTFEVANDSIKYDQVRSSAGRYGNAIHGTDVKSRNAYARDRQESIPDHFADRALPEFLNETTYLTITEADRIRDPIVWDGFRFNHDDFKYLDTDPHIHKVQSNGGFDLYLVDNRDKS